MINFRFHLVSLVAVFLALALGIVMGSTVIDRAIVDGLKNRIDDVEARADARREENLELERRLATLEGYAEQSVAHLVGRRLDGVPVTVVAVRGVDAGAVRTTVETLRDGGATLPGVVWIEPSLAVPDPAARAKLGEAVGDLLRPAEDLRQAVLEALARRLAYGPDEPPGLTAPVPGGTEDLLVALSTGGFVVFDTLGGADVELAGYPQAGARVLVIDGSGARVPTDMAALPLVRSVALAGAPVAFGEVFQPTDSGPARGEVVRAVREDPSLATLVATVDDLDDPRGRAAFALAVDELGRGRAGHYGQGPGASGQLPEPAALEADGTVPGS